MKRSFGDYLTVGLKGAGMGAADVVPGVSGGTIAFITGIYEELIDSIKSINPSNIRLIWKKGIPSFWRAVNGTFLLSIVLGILASVLTLARLLEYLLINHPIQIWSFFFGLILASAVFVARNVKGWDIVTLLSALVGTGAAWWITGISPASTTTALWFVFLSGAIAICAMILPGISGSFILLLLGKYQYVLNAVNQGEWQVLLVLVLGAAIGLISFANLLSWLLRKYHKQTIALLSGFMLGSLNKIWPWKLNLETFTDPHGVVQPLVQKNVLPAVFHSNTGQDPFLAQAILFFAAGILIVVLLELLTTKKAP